MAEVSCEMNIDWVTISVGRIESEPVRTAWFASMRRVIKSHPGAFTRSYFGSYTISLPGRVWQRFAEESDGIELVSDIMSMCATSHVTRVDFAHDWSLSDAAAIWTKFAENVHITRIEGDGKTWYSGSRESPYFARLYDKAKEIEARTGIKIDFPLLRLEIECKRDVAPQLYAHWIRDREDVVSHLVKKYGMSEYIKCSDTSSIIKRLKQPDIDPFAFVRRFQRVIRAAQETDQRLFDELFPRGSAVSRGQE